MSEFKPIVNPYIVGNPITSKSMFYGRKDDFEFLKRKLEKGTKSFIIVFCGERRSGKTSILFQILNGELGEKFLPILVDMQTMAGLKDDAELFEKIAKETFKSLRQNRFSIEKYNFSSHQDSPYKVFDKFLDDIYIQNSDKNFLFLIDEYELIESKIDEGSLSANFIPFLAGVLESERKISFIFTGSKRLDERDNKYWYILFGKSLYRKVSFLSERDTMRLITAPLQNYVTYDEDVLAAIYRLTAGQPFYTQVVCQNIVDHLNETQTNHVDIEDLEIIVEGILENPLPQMIYFWNSLSNNKKLILSLLAEILEDPNTYVQPNKIRKTSRKREFGIQVSIKTIGTTLENLYHNQFVKKTDGQYCFQIDLLRRWIKRDHSIWRVLKEVGQSLREDTGETREVSTEYDRESETIEFDKQKSWTKRPVIISMVVVIGLMVIWFFAKKEETPQGISEKPIIKKEMQAAEASAFDLANKARQSMSAAEQDAIQKEAPRYAKISYESAVQLKDQGFSKYNQRNFARASELFEQAEDRFGEAGAVAETQKSEAMVAEKQKATSRAQQAMSRAKNEALRAKAEGLNPYPAALKKEKEAEEKFDSGDYLGASVLFDQATDLFRKAKTAGIEHAQSRAMIPRNKMGSAKSEAEKVSANGLAKETFGEAAQKEKEARRLFSQEQFEEASAAFEEAHQLYLSAAKKAKMTSEKYVTEAKTFQNNLQKIKAKLDGDFRYLEESQKATEAEIKGDVQLNIGNHAGAIQSYKQAAQLYEKASEARARQILQIHSVIKEYAQALENKNLQQLKSLYLDFTREMQTKWSQVFKAIDKVEAEMSIQDLSFQEKKSTASVDVRLKYSGFVTSDKSFMWEIQLVETEAGWRILNINQDT